MRIESYRASDGTAPFDEFLAKLRSRRAGPRELDAILRRLSLIEAVGFQAAMRNEYLKKLKGYDDVWEVKVGGTALRAFGFLGGSAGAGQVLYLVTGDRSKRKRSERKAAARVEAARDEWILRRKGD